MVIEKGRPFWTSQKGYVGDHRAQLDKSMGDKSFSKEGKSRKSGWVHDNISIIQIFLNCENSVHVGLSIHKLLN